jgi:hypothetical protein
MDNRVQSVTWLGGGHASGGFGCNRLYLLSLERSITLGREALRSFSGASMTEGRGVGRGWFHGVFA